MPLRLKIRARAERDLLRIIKYITNRNADGVIAERFAQRLLDRCHELTCAPGSGSPYQGRPNTRKVVEGAYRIIYREASGQILRIWDGRRGSEPRL